MFPIVIRSFSRNIVRSPMRRHNASAFIDELVTTGMDKRNERLTIVEQFPTKIPIVNGLQHLRSLRFQQHSTIDTLPTAEAWAVFRKRLAHDFKPDVTNWVGIVDTFSRLSSIHFDLSRQARLQPASMYLLPPNWYPKLLELACHSAVKRQNLTAIRDLFRLLNVQRVHFSADLQTKAAELFETYCESSPEIIDALTSALKLGYPISRKVWQRVADMPMERVFSKGIGMRLLDHAAKYWALWLPGAPPAITLHRLILAHPMMSKANMTSNNYLLYLLLGEEFMPQKMLTQIRAGVKVQRRFNKARRVPSNPELEQQLMKEHGAVKIEANVQLEELAGKTVNYLLTKADGKQKVLCDSRMIEQSYFWVVPDDVQGKPSIGFTVNRYLVKRAGYEFGLLK